jgi:hypothetical protein
MPHFMRVHALSGARTDVRTIRKWIDVGKLSAKCGLYVWLLCSVGLKLYLNGADPALGRR